MCCAALGTGAAVKYHSVAWAMRHIAVMCANEEGFAAEEYRFREAGVTLQVRTPFIF